MSASRKLALASRLRGAGRERRASHLRAPCHSVEAGGAVAIKATACRLTPGLLDQVGKNYALYHGQCSPRVVVGDRKRGTLLNGGRDLNGIGGP